MTDDLNIATQLVTAALNQIAHGFIREPAVVVFVSSCGSVLAVHVADGTPRVIAASGLTWRRPISATYHSLRTREVRVHRIVDGPTLTSRGAEA